MDTLPPHAQNDKPSIPAIPGVYKITCIANNRIYIGSSVNLRKRQRNHFSDLRSNKHRNPYLQRAWVKYGEQAFIFEVVELVLVPELLTAQEQYWLNKLKPFGKKGFNIARDAEAPRLGLKHTPESRAKMGLPNIGNQYRLGQKATPETLERLRQSHRGKPSTFKGKHHTPEACEKLRQASLGKTRPPRGNPYRIEGEMTYISLTKGQETVIDTTDLESVLMVTWYAAYNSERKSYSVRSESQEKPLLARYIMNAKEGEHVEHINLNPLDNRRSNLRLVSNQKPNSKTGVRGVTIHKPKNSNRLEYVFRCRRAICKAVKYFPYTEEGLEAARVFSEAHYANMKEA